MKIYPELDGEGRPTGLFEVWSGNARLYGPKSKADCEEFIENETRDDSPSPSQP
ncbi:MULTISPECIES: hypothetical protein [unclassified Mesorhizobium]|uniref:hypothetical protein n=1 Tax=unclassified Mesorhizobium TaxID=325217 RepID=UPI001673315F|nr:MULTISPECIES: hypothetical protein [unclassified Mesorhizobium]